MVTNIRTNRFSFIRTGKMMEPVSSMQDLVQAAGMDYEIERASPYHRIDVVGENGPETQWREHRGSMLRRSDGVIVSGDRLVSDNYSIGTIEQMCEILAPFVDEGFATPDGAATFKDGKVEILSAKLNLDLGDKCDYFLNLSNTHGGGGAFAGFVTGIKEICTNGMRRPFYRAGFTVRHTSKMGDKLREFAFGRWEHAREVIREFADQIKILDSKPCNIPDTVDILLGIQAKPSGEMIDRNGKEISTRLENKRNSLIQLARTSPGVNGKTLADVYNGYTYYLSHSTDGHKTPERAFESTVVGARANEEAKAWETLVELAG